MITEEEVRPVSTVNPCRCERCTQVVHHWFCDNCGEGPWRFSAHTKGDDAPAKPPYGARQYNDRDTGMVSGKRYWCSKTCQQTEEKVYLRSQLEEAHIRKDREAVRILSGRLQELEQHDAQVPSLPEPMTRGDKPLPQVKEPEVVDEAPEAATAALEQLMQSLNEGDESWEQLDLLEPDPEDHL